MYPVHEQGYIFDCDWIVAPTLFLTNWIRTNLCHKLKDLSVPSKSVFDFPDCPVAQDN
jgi:hypothetical protein